MSAVSGSRTPRPSSSRGSATALRIERSAVAVVVQHGFDAATVDMMCADAGVSQRTFFNHFATKEAAVIGTAEPRLDEQRVREFIASTGPNLLAEATALVSLATIDAAADPAFMMARMRAISSSATLLRRQLERFAAVEQELAEVIEYRLTRLSGPDESADEVREQSHVAAHLVAGALRYTATRAMHGEPAGVAAALAATRERLNALLPKLGGATSATTRPHS